jgi:hypothetical protein
MSRKRDRDDRVDLAARLGLTPSDGTSAGRDGADAETGAGALKESESLRRAQRAYRRRRRLVALLVTFLVVLALAALGLVVWSTGVVGGS